jgi:hypothetical protein
MTGFFRNNPQLRLEDFVAEGSIALLRTPPPRF